MVSMSKKRCLSFYYIILFVFLQVFGLFSGVVNTFAEGESALSETQKNTIVDHCDAIRDNLKSLQRADSRTRVYLGRYYETILTSFITPLNIRLVENNISNTNLIDNQTKFVAKRSAFVNDYIVYQQELENLVNTNCRTEPEKFYQNLVTAREKRAVVNRDVVRLRQMTGDQVKLVEELKKSLAKTEVAE